jgi:hypothetical protein
MMFSSIWGSHRHKAKSSKVTPSISGDNADGGAKTGLIGQSKTTGDLTEYRSSTHVVNGTKTYDSSQTLLKGLTGMRFVEEGDFNGDGWADIAAVDASGNAFVYWNTGTKDVNGNVSYKAPVKAGTLQSVDKILVVDVDGDGKDDIVYRKSGTGDLYALLSNGDGTFTSIVKPVAVADANDNWYAAADVTGDGIPDMLRRNSQGTLIITDPTTGKDIASYAGWNSASQIVLSYVTNGPLPAIVYKDAANELRVLPEVSYSGGTFTWGSSTVIGTGWGGSDLIA